MNRAISAAGFFGPYALLLASLFFSGIFYESYQLPKAFAFLVFSFFFAPLSALSRGKAGFKPVEIVMFVLFFFTASYALLSPHHPPFYYIAAAFAPAAFFIFFYSPVRPRAFTLFASLLLSASFFYAVVQFSQRGIERPYSFFGNPVFAAEFAGALIPFALAGVFLAGREKYFHLAALLLFVPAMILFSSRGAALSSVISCACLIFMLRKQAVNFFSVKKAAASLLILAAVILLLPGFSGSLKTFFTRAGSAGDLSSPAVTNRVMMGKAAISMWKKSPVFGNGFGAYGELYQKEQARFLGAQSPQSFIKTAHAHNDYLQLLAETGIAGLLLFLGALFASVYCFEKNSPFMQKERFILSAASVSSVIFICSASFFNFPLFSMPACFIFFGMCGLSCNQALRGGKRDYAGVPAASCAAAVFLALPFVLAAAFGIHRHAAADSYLKSALNGSNPENNYSRAAELDPAGFHVLYHYASHKTTAGKYEETLALLKKSLYYHPHSADTSYNAGAILSLLGRHDEAMGCYKSAIALYPGFEEANAGAFHSLTALGREDEALNYLAPAAASGRLKEAQEKSGIILREEPFESR